MDVNFATKRYYDKLRNGPTRWNIYLKWARNHKQVRRLRVIDYYSKGTRRCNCCGETQLQFMQIDHINNDGYKNRKLIKQSNIENWILKNNYPEGFQILCANCNFGRRINKGVCPHQLKEVMVN